MTEFLPMPGPLWLDPAEVLAWLRINPVTPADTSTMSDVCAAVELEVQRCRPDGFHLNTDDPPVLVWSPTADIILGAHMFAGRVFQRRMTPSGVQAFSSDSVTFVASFDPEVNRFLRQGPWAVPVVG